MPNLNGFRLSLKFSSTGAALLCGYLMPYGWIFNEPVLCKRKRLQDGNKFLDELSGSYNIDVR